MRKMEILKELKILYVEDDKFAQEQMKHFLKKRAGHFFAAFNGAEGLEKCELCSPDIVIADLLMPEMDGITMIKQLRNSGYAGHIVVITSVNTSDTVIEAVNTGIDYYIVKPLDFAELELKLNQIGEKIQAERSPGKGVLDFLEEKQIYEDRIKKSFVKSLKEFTGKGSRETVVQLLGNKITVTSFGALTTSEENLLQERKNYEVIKQMRMLTYEALAGKLEANFSEVLDLNVTFEEAVIFLKKKMEQAVFHAEKR